MKEMNVSVLRNPALMLAVGLPAFAVVASVLTLFIAIGHGDAQLPEQYHWEGFQLDRDFSRGERAQALRVRSEIAGLNSNGACELRLHITGASTPDNLALMLAHATQPVLDQRVTFRRLSVSEGKKDALYVGQCKGAREGNWRLELSDETNGWAIRTNIGGSLDHVTLDAGATGGG